MRVIFAVLVSLCAGACSEPGPGPATLRVTIVGDRNDSRIAATREAIAHWNEEFSRLGMRLRFDEGPPQDGPIPESAMQAASAAQTRPWAIFSNSRLQTALARVPGDVIIALSKSDLISFGVPWGRGKRGIAGIRPADRPPLSLPNTLRNVLAHELGHVLGLEHNADPKTLMCGRPAPCRPAAFASDTPHFFPLTGEDERELRRRWP